MLRLAVLLSFLILFGVEARAQGLEAVGLWATADRDAVIQIYPCEEGSLCGRFYWLKDDSAENPSLDDRNPDSERRKRPLCGLTFMGGFDQGGQGGWIYSARHGSTFSASLTMDGPDRLVLRGYMFLPLFGGGQTWTRLAQHPACPLFAQQTAR